MSVCHVTIGQGTCRHLRSRQVYASRSASSLPSEPGGSASVGGTLLNDKVVLARFLEVVEVSLAAEELYGYEILKDSSTVFGKRVAQGGKTGIGQEGLPRVYDSGQGEKENFSSLITKSGSCR